MISGRKFLSCDWGVSTFRLRLVESDRKISGEFISEEGMAETHRRWIDVSRPESDRIDFYKETLKRAISQLPVPVDTHAPMLISGMASSSIGIAELPYQKFPFTWDVSQFIIQKIEGDEKFKNPLYIISGFRTEHDIMRGEETLLLGCDAGDKGESIFIFPGTHSKHVYVHDKREFDFKTFMTGEIFNLLAEKSILRNAVKKEMIKNHFPKGCWRAKMGTCCIQRSE